MAALEDRAFMKVCAHLASCLGITIASARRKVDLAATRVGVKDLAGRKAIADSLLKEALSLPGEGEESVSVRFDQLLSALAEEENFMVED